MAGGEWSKSVELAVARLAAREPLFSLQQLIDAELGRIVRETGSRGATPEATLRRELQQLRDRGGIEFLGRGEYRLTTQPIILPMVSPSKCVFLVGDHSMDSGEIDRFYRFEPQRLQAAARSVGQLILFQEPKHVGNRGYFATARVEQIVRDPVNKEMFFALIEPSSYLDFGCEVQLQADPDSNQQIRAITDEEFERIVGLGLVAESDALPRDDDTLPNEKKVREESEPWLGPLDRTTALVSRVVRNRQFRKRVLEIYDNRCALTGIQLINGGGRAEAQAAHIMSVESGGPDTITNGIALSGTVHWMFDRGLIALSNAGEILLSQKINDLDGVVKLLHADRRARFPANENVRPHERFLAWHREYHHFAA